VTTTSTAPATAGAAPVRSGRSDRLRWALVDGWTVARRNLTHVRHMPEKLMDVTVQPVLFVLLFTYVFGSAIEVPGSGSYKEFLMAGIFAQTLTFTCAGTAISMADDMSKGVVDRFRSLPIARSAVLVGRTSADLVTGLIGLAFLVGTALVVGWRVHEGLPRALAGLAILMLFGFAMNWLGTLVGLIVRDPESAQQVMFLVAFPLSFVANTFVPTEGMPSWLRIVANWNPLSSVVGALRQLFGNAPVPTTGPWPVQHPVPAALLWSFGILGVCLPLAVRRYRRAVAH
jgi:ABC transporter DrrB family efflux protein